MAGEARAGAASSGSALIGWARYLLGAGYCATVLYLCVITLAPAVRKSAPAALQWFGAPGSYSTIALVLAFAAGVLVLSKLAGPRLLTLPTVVVLTVMAASALVLGLSSFWQCHGDQSPFFAPLAWTLALFVGSVEQRFGAADGSCSYLPVALELARLLAIATTLTTALTAALALFRKQLDRVAIWRARSLTVIVGVDEDTIALVRAVAERMDRRSTLVVVTSNAERPVVALARQVGARVRTVPFQDAKALAELRLWKRLDRLYLLSEDPAQNEARLDAINTAMDHFGDERRRLPLTVRIDDPWQAEVWRRSFLETAHTVDNRRAHKKRWIADAVGRYETTAANLVRHLTDQHRGKDGLPAAETVVLCGLYPLTYALSSELAQVCREQDLVARADVVPPTHVVIMACGAPSFVDDHNLRQERMTPRHRAISLEPCDFEPTVESISAYVSERNPRTCAIVLAHPEMERYGTRLAARFPQLRIYQAAASAVTLQEFSIVGRLFTFPITMEIDPGAPQDVWERAAELIHEHYSAGEDRDKWSARPWKDLDPFVQQSNRRLVVNTLWLVEDGGHSWNTLENPPPPPISVGFAAKTPVDQLHELGFDPQTVDRMIGREHDDWRRFYEAAGWRYSPDRNDAKQRHDRLLPWSELKRRDEELLLAENVVPPDDRLYATRAQRALVSTLLNLRSLGYRSIPKPSSQWQQYRRRGEVSAERRDHDWNWATQADEQMQAKAGDWSVTDERGREHSVATEAFDDLYLEIGPGRYRRAGVVKARQVMAEETVQTREGDAVAHSGDWIVEGPLREMWPVSATEFVNRYEGPIDDEPAGEDLGRTRVG